MNIRNSATAVVTGGSGGIGAAAVRQFHRNGMRVAILDVARDAGESLAAELGAGADFHYCDVSDAAAVEDVAEKVTRDSGPVEVLVTSAARLGSNFSTVMDLDMESHDRTWRVNYHGTLNACRSYGRRMIAAQRGSIVTVGSIHGSMPMPLPAYNPGKAAVARLTQLLAVELGRFGIRVNSVAPTYVLTEMMRQNIATGKRDKEKLKALHALDRLPEPEDIANAIDFLCSDAASMITGVTLPVDCGLGSAVSYKTYAGGVPWA